MRILLTASKEARLARRSKELHGDADAASVDATRSQVVDRDRADSTVSQFTVAADGVTTIDTSHLDFEAQVEAVLRVVAGHPRREPTTAACGPASPVRPALVDNGLSLDA